jgi:parallel beta-helix repeat protein
VRLNHAAGIKAGNGQGLDNNEQILSNNVHNNGQEGIAVNSGTGTVVEYNTVSSNNYLNLVAGVEAGGGRICGTTGAQIINNTFSNNNGDGVWGDCGATSTTFLDNTITGNSLSGIRYELSHAGTISDNTLVNNAQSQAGSCNAKEREIFLVSSDNTSVAGNTITSNCAGIALAQDSRNPTVNNSVTYNSTTYSGSVVLPYGIGGIDLLAPTAEYHPSSQNYFDYNTYHFGSPSMLTLNNWLWGSAGGSPTQMNWSAWQAAGEDPNGSAH